MSHKFKLGSKIRDKVSGVEGITTSRTEFLNGCIQYNIHPKADKDGKHVDIYNYDEQQLELIDDGIHKNVSPPKPTGGAMTQAAPSR